MQDVIQETMTILEVMDLLNTLPVKTVYVVKDNKVIGSITDGDIRRYVIATRSMEGTAADCMKTPCRTCLSKEEGNALISQYGIQSIPLVNEENEILYILYNHAVLSKPAQVRDEYKDIQVVMMAGGKGERLYPYTNVLPKPLIPIAGTPISQRILTRFQEAGLTNYILSLNYKKNIIKAYYDDAMEGCSFTFVEENKPLGTGGSLKLMEDLLHDDFFVVNCDTLIDADINNLLDLHKEEGNLLTVVSALKQVSIPYGVIDTDADGQILALREKPSIKQFINTGMYVISKKAFEYFPNMESFHMTQIIENLLAHNQRVGTYIIPEEGFLDMGVISGLNDMNQKLR